MARAKGKRQQKQQESNQPQVHPNVLSRHEAVENIFQQARTILREAKWRFAGLVNLSTEANSDDNSNTLGDCVIGRLEFYRANGQTVAIQIDYDRRWSMGFPERDIYYMESIEIFSPVSEGNSIPDMLDALRKKAVA